MPRIPELDFDGQNTLYATHGLHAFAAKCPPQLARYAIRYYSRPGDTVLDPMAGSGTTLVEARLLGRTAVGVEIDPVARLIAKVKSTPVADSSITEAQQAIEEWIEQAISGRRSAARLAMPVFHNRDYWFRTDVSQALALLTQAIAATPMPADIRDFFWVALSSPYAYGPAITGAVG
jgi:hypothetical protein